MVVRTVNDPLEEYAPKNFVLIHILCIVEKEDSEAMRLGIQWIHIFEMLGECPIWLFSLLVPRPCEASIYKSWWWLFGNVRMKQFHKSGISAWTCRKDWLAMGEDVSSDLKSHGIMDVGSNLIRHQSRQSRTSFGFVKHTGSNCGWWDSGNNWCKTLKRRWFTHEWLGPAQLCGGAH